MQCCSELIYTVLSSNILLSEKRQKNYWRKKSAINIMVFKEMRIQVVQKTNQERAMNMLLLCKALLAQVIAKVP